MEFSDLFSEKCTNEAPRKSNRREKDGTNDPLCFPSRVTCIAYFFSATGYCDHRIRSAETRTSLPLYGVILPETLKSSTLRRLGFPDAAALRAKDLDCADAPPTFLNYISAFAD